MPTVGTTPFFIMKIFGADLSQHKTKKRHNSLLYNLLCRYELRRQDWTFVNVVS